MWSAAVWDHGVNVFTKKLEIPKNTTPLNAKDMM